MKTLSSSIINQNIFQSLSILPNPSKVLRDKALTAEVYHHVARQPDIFSATQNYRDALSAMTYTASDAFMSDYLLHSGILEQLTRYASSARDYGMAVLEIVKYDTYKGRVVPIELDVCPIERFHFDTERTLRLKVPGSPLGIDVLKTYPNKFILLRSDATFSNPYGVALLDIAYWLSVGLNGNFEFMMQFAEQDGRDKWIAYCPPDTLEETKQNILLEAARLRANGIALIEEGMRLEPKDYKGRSASTDLYKTINELCLRKVEKLWYGTDLTMQVEGKGGYSSSRTGVDIREDALGAGKRLVKEALQILTSYIASINAIDIQSNFVIASNNETSKEEAEIDEIYFNMGLKPTADFFKKRGYEEDEFTLADKAPTNNQVQANKQNAQFSQEETLLDIFDVFKKDLSQNPKK